jgi:hypothetical protein
MNRNYFLILIIFLLSSFNNIENTHKTDTFLPKSIIKSVSIAKDTLPSKDSNVGIGIERIFQSDTFRNLGKSYVLQIIKVNKKGNQRDNWFVVKKQIGKVFKVILKDDDFGINNSGLYAKDNNNDGYLDIVWDKKWQEHAYLFNPKIENFVEVGECHTIDTLKTNGQIAYYNGIYPLLYFVNKEKGLYDMNSNVEWIRYIHSELFVIDDKYEKISFATLDNSASLKEYNIKKCQRKKESVINCYIPPYRGNFGAKSIWNIGKSIDSFQIKTVNFNDKFINKYWQDKYNSLMIYGKKNSS